MQTGSMDAVQCCQLVKMYISCVRACVRACARVRVCPIGLTQVQSKTDLLSVSDHCSAEGM